MHFTVWFHCEQNVSIKFLLNFHPNNYIILNYNTYTNIITCKTNQDTSLINSTFHRGDLFFSTI